MLRLVLCMLYIRIFVHKTMLSNAVNPNQMNIKTFDIDFTNLFKEILIHCLTIIVYPLRGVVHRIASRDKRPISRVYPIIAGSKGKEGNF